MGAYVRQTRGLDSRRGNLPVVFLAMESLAALLLAVSLAPSRLQAQNPRVSIEPDLLAQLRDLRKVPALPGEICIVCGQAVGADDDAYVLDGQRVAVHRQQCEAKLAKHPARYLGRLRPHGSQFMDTMPPSDGWVSWWGWLAIGLYVLAGLVFAAVCGYAALNRSINPLPWFFTGLFLNVFGYLFLLARSSGQRVPAIGSLPRGMVKIPATASPRLCPKCGSPNHPAALRCANCGWALNPQLESEVARAGLLRS